MSILYLLLGVSVVVAMVVALTFLWAVRSGQFEGLDQAAYSIFDDEDDRDRDTGSVPRRRDEYE